MHLIQVYCKPAVVHRLMHERMNASEHKHVLVCGPHSFPTLNCNTLCVEKYVTCLSVRSIQYFCLPFESRLSKLSLKQRHRWETKRRRQKQHSDAQMIYCVPRIRSVTPKYSLYAHSLALVFRSGTTALSSYVSPWVEKVGGADKRHNHLIVSTR